MPARKRAPRERGSKARVVRLKIEAKDFGPISSGEIALKPLTIFIGPNNSGKSYAAMLIHSIFECCTPIPFPRGLPPGIVPRGLPPGIARRRMIREFINIPTLRQRLVRGLLPMKRQIGALSEGQRFEIPKSLLQRVSNDIIREIYEKRLNDEIVRSYACRLKELVRIGQSSFSLTIGLDSYSVCLKYEKGKLRVKHYPRLDFDVKISPVGEADYPYKVIDRDTKVLVQIPTGETSKEKELTLFRLLSLIPEICGDRVLKHAVMACHYLPAARSGILQGHKALAASIIKKIPYVGIESLEIPRFSGVVSDFISSVIDLPEEKGPFYSVAQRFERELIDGEIVVRTTKERPYPEIKYKFRNTEIELHRASSTVSELAPLFLYAKYAIRAGDVLIIEEPEAHLHPENQRILAKFLVRLIRKGVAVAITTHSEYLLEQLSSFILLSRISPLKRVRRYRYAREDFLKSDEVSAYVLRYDAKSGGYRIGEVEITEEDGISQEEFIKIHDVLYEEAFRLGRDLDTAT